MRVFKRVLILFFFITFQSVISQENEYQQEKSILVGFGPTLELDQNLYGINARIYYGVNESFCFGPEVSYFPFQKIGEKDEESIVDLNFNAHYIIELNENIGLYPLSGVNYTIEIERSFEYEKQEKDFGLNYGAGMHYKLKDLFLL